MARIREYQQRTTAQASIPGRRAQASDFGGTGLRDLGEAISQTTSALEAQASQLEVTDAHAQLSKAHADWTLNLTDRGRQAVPGGETFATKFNEDLRKYLDDLRERFQTAQGQQTFDRGAAQLSANFVAQSGKFQSGLAGKKAVEDFGTTVDSLQIVVSNDPSQFEAAKNRLEEIIDDPESTYSRIPPMEREKVKKEAFSQLAKSTMEEVVIKSPEIGKQLLENPSSNASQYLTGEQLSSLKAKADVGIEKLRTTKEREALVKRREEIERNKALEDEFIIRILTPKHPDGMPSDPEIAASGMDAPYMRTVHNFKLDYIRDTALAAKGTPITKEPSVFLGALQDIRSGVITTEPQIEAVYSRSVERGAGIDWTQVTTLRNELTDLRTPEGTSLINRKDTFMKGISPSIDKSNPMMGRIDASGKKQVMEFEFFVDQKISQYKDDPKKDPHDLFDPSKPDYLGKGEVLLGFQKTMNQSIKDFADQMRRSTSSPPTADELRKVGESISEYLKRTEK